MSQITKRSETAEIRPLTEAEVDGVSGGFYQIHEAAVRFFGLFAGDGVAQDCSTNWDGIELCKA